MKSVDTTQSSNDNYLKNIVEKLFPKKKYENEEEFDNKVKEKRLKYSYNDYINGNLMLNDENSENHIDEDEHDMDEIVKNIWLGNFKAAYDRDELDKHNIKYVINITDTIECPFDDKLYLYIPIRDKYSCHYASKHFIIRNYLKAFKFIDEALNRNKGVLIHCKKGHHRSANILLFYLIYKYNMGYIKALMLIKSKRPQALCRKTCINKWGMDVYKFLITKDKKYL